MEPMEPSGHEGDRRWTPRGTRGTPRWAGQGSPAVDGVDVVDQVDEAQVSQLYKARAVLIELTWDKKLDETKNWWCEQLGWWMNKEEEVEVEVDR